MNNFILSTDKCCDEYANDLNNRNIEYIPIAFICGEEVTYDRFSTEEEYKEFYRQQI